jgi:hypothetical protein
LRDHILNYYLTEAHSAVEKAEHEQLIQDEASEQVQVILRVQQLIEQQLGGFAQQLAQIDQAAQQFKPQPPMPPDNSMQVAQIGAQVQQAAIQQRAQSDQARIASQQQIAAQRLAAEEQARNERLAQENMRQSAENQRTAEEIASRERMNTADNDTAMRLAAAEIASGEKIAVSTGTGINPGAR